jgi:hypothetical protein
MTPLHTQVCPSSSCPISFLNTFHRHHSLFSSTRLFVQQDSTGLFAPITSLILANVATSLKAHHIPEPHGPRIPQIDDYAIVLTIA